MFGQLSEANQDHSSSHLPALLDVHSTPELLSINLNFYSFHWAYKPSKECWRDFRIQLRPPFGVRKEFSEPLRHIRKPLYYRILLLLSTSPLTHPFQNEQPNTGLYVFCCSICRLKLLICDGSKLLLPAKRQSVATCTHQHYPPEFCAKKRRGNHPMHYLHYQSHLGKVDLSRSCVFLINYHAGSEVSSSSIS